MNELNDSRQVRLLRIKQVTDIIPLSRSHIYALIADGRFPTPVPLIAGGRGVGWWAHEIYAFAQQRYCETRGGVSHE
jgi:prophage regulatory protein